MSAVPSEARTGVVPGAEGELVVAVVEAKEGGSFSFRDQERLDAQKHGGDGRWIAQYLCQMRDRARWIGEVSSSFDLNELTYRVIHIMAHSVFAGLSGFDGLNKGDRAGEYLERLDSLLQSGEVDDAPESVELGTDNALRLATAFACCADYASGIKLLGEGQANGAESEKDVLSGAKVGDNVLLFARADGRR